MSKISLENEFNIKALNRLKELGYPECSATPLTADEIKNLKIGTVCYVVPLQSPLKLSMFIGYCLGIFSFDSYMGTCQYKERNTGKTYNVFLAHMKEE